MMRRFTFDVEAVWFEMAALKASLNGQQREKFIAVTHSRCFPQSTLVSGSESVNKVGGDGHAEREGEHVRMCQD